MVDIGSLSTGGPGVRFEPRTNGVTIVRYGHSELGVLYPERGVAELPVPDREHDILIEHGDAEPADLTAESFGVSHSVRGPADITAVLGLFDRHYRDLRGEDDSYSSEDPDSARTAGPAIEPFFTGRDIP
jgi:hypothetical protein